MKRFVTYIYQYDRGIRGKNVGFIKADIRDAGCRMEIHIRGLERFQGRGKIYLIVSSENALAISAGELLLSQGAGRAQMSYPNNLLGDSGYTVDQIQAVVIRYGGGKLLASCWGEHVPEAVLYGQFEVWQAQPENNLPDTEPVNPGQAETIPIESEPDSAENLPSNQPEAIPAKSEPDSAENLPPNQTESIPIESTPEDTAPETESITASPSDDADYIPKIFTAQHTDHTPTPAPQITYKKIEITDIRKLPKRNWYLCNNSFLIHGFFNYHYLMLKTIETDGRKNCYLGVPGIYEQPERMMALLFGFPEFEPAEQSRTDNGTDMFGYWMCQLDLTPNP